MEKSEQSGIRVKLNRSEYELSADYMPNWSVVDFQCLGPMGLGEIDKKLMVLLRDGRTLIGHLRSVDQFANLVLHQTIERIHVNKKYGDIPRGIFIIRGENVVLLGEIDSEKEANLNLTEVSVEEILDLQRREQETRFERNKLIAKALKERGLTSNSEIAQDDAF